VDQVQHRILLKYQHTRGSENSCSAWVFLDIGCCCGCFWGVPPGRNRYVMAFSPVIHNKARLCTVALAPRWALGQELKCHRDVLAQGLRDKHQSEKEEFARVQRTTVRWFGLPFPTALNSRVVLPLSKPFETLGTPPKTLPAVWLPEC